MTQATPKPAPSMMQKGAGLIGMLAFIVGVILSIVGGIAYMDNSGIALALIIVGIIVGLLNVTGKEVLPLLVAAIALMVVGVTKGFTPLNDLTGADGTAGTHLNAIVAYLALFMIPAAVISAFRIMWKTARPGD